MLAGNALPRLEHPWISGPQGRVYQIDYPESDSGPLIDSYIDELQAYYRQLDQPVGWVLDCSRIRHASAGQLQQLAEHDRALNPLHQRLTAGMAFVVPSPLARGLLRAVYWFSPPVYPHAIFTSHASARAWIDRQLLSARWAA